MKTVKRIAEEIGVSKQAVFYRIKKAPLSEALRPYITKVDDTLQVAPEGEAIIKEAFNLGAKEAPNVAKETITETLVDMLRLELEAKNRQIDVKDAQIAEQQTVIKDLTAIIATKDAQVLDLTTSLNAAQALHAGTIQWQLSEDKEREADAEAEAASAREKPRTWKERWMALWSK